MGGEINRREMLARGLCTAGMLASVGVGTNDPERIEVASVPLKEAVFPFRSPPPAKE